MNIRSALLAVCLLAGPLGCQSEPLEVAPSVNLSQLQGKWYEIARLPRTTETDCHGTTAFYTQAADGSLSLVNQCNVGGPTGKLQTISMRATVPDSSVPAKLALNVGGYTGDYWVLEVGKSYEYAVVGHPSRLYFWILSRTPTLSNDVLAGILERAKSEHFETEALEFTPQPPAGERNDLSSPQGDVPEPPHSTCAVALGAAGSRQASSLGSSLLGIVGAALTLRRRRAARR